MSPQPAPAGPAQTGRPARNAAAAALWAALTALIAGSLQGCAVKFLENKREGKSPLEVCPAFKFQHDGFVAEARAGELVNVTCPTDFTYTGPAIQCSWVDKFCVTYDQHKINPEFCYNQYNLTLAGQGLSSWPEDLDPKIMPLPTAGGGGGSVPGMPGAPGSHFPGSVNTSQLAGRRLATALPRIITPDHLTCEDEGYAELDFESTSVDSSQQLDSKYAWSLRYRDITSMGSQKVDLLVTTVKVNISGKPERTGKGSAMGRININCSNTVPFKFQFVRSGTDDPFTMKKVFFTLFDIVDTADPKNDKQVTVGSMREYFVSKKTRVIVEKLDNGEYTFGRGPLSENVPGKPVDIEKAKVKDMWLDSLNRTVVLMFRNVSEFMIYIKVTPGKDGRDFEFTGWSEVAKMGRKVYCEPQQKIEAKFALPATVRLGRTRPRWTTAVLAPLLGVALVALAALRRPRGVAAYAAPPCGVATAE